MDIAALSISSMGLNASPTIGLAVLGKSLDATEQAGTDLLKMMEQSVLPDLGQNIDLLL